MIYAPIMITTLNRYEHFVRLISSLQKNEWAKYTELFIAVDFPPSKQYVSGYNKICEYVNKGIDGFKNVNIIFRDKNYGAVYNYEMLRDVVIEKYDRYIVFEDDNEVAPCLLEYMDKMLELYYDDENVIAICGHIHERGIVFEGYNLIKNGFTYDGWGVAEWVHKNNAIREKANFDFFEKLLLDTKRALRLHAISKEFFRILVENIFFLKGYIYLGNKEVDLCDTAMSIYMIDQGCYTISPYPSLVRNYGDDGSGLHSGTGNILQYQYISLNESFDENTTKMFVNDELIAEKIKKDFSCSFKRDVYTLTLWFFMYIKKRVEYFLKEIK